VSLPINLDKTIKGNQHLSIIKYYSIKRGSLSSERILFVDTAATIFRKSHNYTCRTILISQITADLRIYLAHQFFIQFYHFELFYFNVWKIKLASVIPCIISPYLFSGNTLLKNVECCTASLFPFWFPFQHGKREREREAVQHSTFFSNVFPFWFPFQLLPPLH